MREILRGQKSVFKPVKKMMSRVFSNRTQQVMTRTFLLCLVTIWVFYGLFGRQLITILYKSKSIWIADQIMGGRALTPIENYYLRADELMMIVTFWFVTLYLVVVILIRKPLGALLTGSSLLLSSFLLFCFLEMFPSLIRPLHLDIISPYFVFKGNYIYDEQLAFRERPFNRAIIHGFRGSNYSPIYGIDVPPVTVEWITDENGFKNNRTTNSSDIVVLGDSFIEYGDNEADTFVKRLEKKLPGMTVTNLGKSGYGPFQYLEVLKRFGLKYKPKYALLSFYEGNDVDDVRSYSLWKRGVSTLYYEVWQKSLLQRYWTALRITVVYIMKHLMVPIQLTLDKIAQMRGYGYNIHPDLAVLNLGDGKHYKALLYELSTASTEKMLASEEGQALNKVLRDFRDVCAKNHIVPIILYIPAPGHIYAQYSTKASGGRWLQIRESQIAAKENTANGVKHLAQELHIASFDLSPAFELAAKKGMLLYYSLDGHWNSEGREVAASFVAATLQSKYNLIQ